MSRAALKFNNLTLGYERRPAVHHLDGEVSEGALLAIAGPNGAGKSTLVKAIAGVLAPLDGQIEGLGILAQDIAYLPQAAEIDRSFPICVHDLVSMGKWRKIGIFNGLAASSMAKISAAIAAVGLQGFEDRPIGTLSGGQMQRALFARLLLQEARIILLDEPFAAIDTKTVADLLRIIQQWHREKRTVIAVLHDQAIIREFFPQTLLLAREVIAWGATEPVLSPENLALARQRLEAVPGHAEICEKAA